MRIDVIRSTTFVPAVYGVAYIGTGVLTVELLLLIADLDNPFGAGQAMSVENVSLQPVALALHRLRRGVGQWPPSSGAGGDAAMKFQ